MSVTQILANFALLYTFHTCLPPPLSDHLSPTSSLPPPLSHHLSPTTSLPPPLSRSQVQFSPDGRYILSASFDKSVKLWDGFKGTFISTFR